MRALVLVVALLGLAGAAFAAENGGDSPAEFVLPDPGPPDPSVPPAAPVPPAEQTAPGFVEPVQWRRSRSLGLPYAGRLVNGVKLPEQGELFFTWDPVLKQTPNRSWRRWGADRTLRKTLGALARFAVLRPDAPRVGIGDISRPRGGDFSKRFGALGHASHQNGRDVDVYYPRVDRAERAPRTVPHVDRELAQTLVDLFVEAGARKVFVGPSLGLKGPRRIVVPLVHHDNHLHARF